MNKEDLVNEFAEKAHVSKEKAGELITVLFDPNNGIIPRAVRRDGELALAGFGKLFTRVLPARNSRNPQTGEQFIAPPKRVIRFTAGTTFATLVAGKAIKATEIPASKVKAA